MVSKRIVIASSLISLLVGACKDSIPGTPNYMDARADVSLDSQINKPKDMFYEKSAKDGSVDGMTPDIGPDSNTDSGFTRDARLDAPARDMGRDLGYDSFAVDGGNDAGRDMGLDSRVADMGIDLGTDLGTDAPIGPRPYECDPYTVALYHFDEPDPFLDSCDAHNLRNLGSTGISGRVGFGEARSLDGINDYLDTPSAEDLNFGSIQDFRIRANIRTTATLANYDTILGKTLRTPTTTGYSIFYYSGSGWGCLYWDRDRSEEVYSLATLNDGLWHEIICERTNNGTRATIYIDGLEMGTATITPANTDSLAPLVIGNMSHGIELNQGYFEGEIDDVEIERIE